MTAPYDRHRHTRRSARALAAALALLPALACYEARLDAIAGGGAADGGPLADTGAQIAPADGGDAQPLPAACLPGASVEQEPNDENDRATATSASAICGSVVGSDVDFFRLLATDAGAVTSIVVEQLTGDGLGAVLFVDGIQVANSSIQGNGLGSMTMTPPPGTTSDSILRIVSLAGGNAEYVLRVTR